MPFERPTWHLLQHSDVLDLEFASALAETVPVTLWEPDRSALPWRPHYESSDRPHPGSSLRMRSFPIMRGYARCPDSVLARIGQSLADRLIAASASPGRSPLVCTIPYFAHVARCWPGPVVYWLTDRISEYSSARRDAVRQLDREMVAAATLVAPNSQRLAEYLISEAGCDPNKIVVLPNATRAANLLPSPTGLAEPRPAEIRELPGPLAGVLGNLSGNMDWVQLETLIDLTPKFTWVFVGPLGMDMTDPEQQRARAAILQHARCHFTGARPYGDLVHYARAFNVAVLPYLRREPTYSGSSTRFYEHLAACQPMLAFPGVHELLDKSPLLQIVRGAGEAAQAMEQLRRADFEDGQRQLRWRVSRLNTWQVRATTMQSELAIRLTGPQSSPGKEAKAHAQM